MCVPYCIYKHCKKYDFFQNKKKQEYLFNSIKITRKINLKMYLFYEKVNFAIKKYFFYSAIVVGEIKSIN